MGLFNVLNTLKKQAVKRLLYFQLQHIEMKRNNTQSYIHICVELHQLLEKEGEVGVRGYNMIH